MNEYLSEFQKCGGARTFEVLIRSNGRDYTDYRDKLTSKYAWAVPDDKAIELIVRYSPIVEIGAGTGYWASLIQAQGGVVFPFDSHVPGVKTNPYRHAVTYTSVLTGSIEVLDKLSNFALFLCWPPYDDSFAYDALKRYRGDTLIYIGEDAYGCTANMAFFDEVSKHWLSIEEHRLPQWDGIHDYLNIYKRIR